MLNFGASKPRVKGGARAPGAPPWIRTCKPCIEIYKGYQKMFWTTQFRRLVAKLCYQPEIQIQLNSFGFRTKSTIYSHGLYLTIFLKLFLFLVEAKMALFILLWRLCVLYQYLNIKNCVKLN